MDKDYDFIITHHARERFVERFSKESPRFAHLSKCKLQECPLCRDLTFTISDLVTQHKAQWDGIICAKLHEARDVRVIQNNTIFMDYIYRKHGYGRFSFLVESDILFVVIVKNGKNVVVTCMNVHNPVHGTTMIADFIRRPKFKKRREVVYD